PRGTWPAPCRHAPAAARTPASPPPPAPSPARAGSAPSATTRGTSSSVPQVEPAGGFGYRAGDRRVDGEGLGYLVDGETGGHGERDRVDEFAGSGRYDDAADDDAGVRETEEF